MFAEVQHEQQHEQQQAQPMQQAQHAQQVSDIRCLFKCNATIRRTTSIVNDVTICVI
jgi:hypothetical protein